MAAISQIDTVSRLRQILAAEEVCLLLYGQGGGKLHTVSNTVDPGLIKTVLDYPHES